MGRIASCLVFACLCLASSISDWSGSHRWCVDEESYSRTEGEVCSADSVWNYHIRNEVWLIRDDPGVESPYLSHYEWRAFDSTPSVVDQGRYQVCPAPPSSIELGETNATYEADAYFDHVLESHGGLKPVIDFGYKCKRDWLIFNFIVDDTLKMGEDIVVKLVLATVRKSVEKVHIQFRAESSTLRGDTSKTIYKGSLSVTLPPGQLYEAVLKFPVNMYADKLYYGNRLDFHSFAYVEGKDQTWSNWAISEFEAPRLNFIELPASKLNGSSTVLVTFDNPLPITLTHCNLSLQRIKKTVGPVPAYGHFETSIDNLPKESLIPAFLFCDEIEAMTL